MILIASVIMILIASVIMHWMLRSITTNSGRAPITRFPNFRKHREGLDIVWLSEECSGARRDPGLL